MQPGMLTVGAGPQPVGVLNCGSTGFGGRPGITFVPSSNGSGSVLLVKCWKYDRL